MSKRWEDMTDDERRGVFQKAATNTFMGEDLFRYTAVERLGLYVSRLREDAGLSLEGLAARIGSGTGDDIMADLVRLERDDEASGSLLRQVLDALGTPAQEIIDAAADSGVWGCSDSWSGEASEERELLASSLPLLLRSHERLACDPEVGRARPIDGLVWIDPAPRPGWQAAQALRNASSGPSFAPLRRDLDLASLVHLWRDGALRFPKEPDDERALYVVRAVGSRTTGELHLKAIAPAPDRWTASVETGPGAIRWMDRLAAAIASGRAERAFGGVEGSSSGRQALSVSTAIESLRKRG